MEPIYVWKRAEMDKYLVLEGATRVTILRDLTRRKKGKPDADKNRRVVAKVLPPDFDEEARVILLARIHVRGTGVRAWGRYIEAKFIHDNVTPQNGQKAVMTVRNLARYMGKSDSWVSRLKDAYEFASRFVDYLDTEDAQRLAVKHFSTLEEVSKATGFGAQVRDYANSESEALRDEVFEMVRNDVFKEYRDARFIAKFHDDPEKWAQLKTHEKFIANKLANEEKVGTTSLSGKIDTLKNQITRSFDRGDNAALDEDDLANLQTIARQLASQLNAIEPFRLHVREFSKALEEVSLAEVKAITLDEWEGLKAGMADFEDRLNKHKTWKQ
jgi:hypothetical protein